MTSPKRCGSSCPSGTTCPAPSRRTPITTPPISTRWWISSTVGSVSDLRSNHQSPRKTTMKIVCIDGEAQYKDIVLRDVAAPLEAAGHQFDWFEESFADVEATIARASGYDALYVVGDQGPVPPGLLRANPTVTLVSFVGTGARRFVAMDEAAECGVTVTNVPDFASQSVAEHALALVFAAGRRIAEGDNLVRAGRWEKKQGLKLAGR